MKNCKNVIKCFFVILLVFNLCCVNTVVVFAHEVFYDGSTGVPLRWNNVTNRTAYLYINGDSLDSNYSSHYSVIRTAWSNASARVSITATNFSNSNVDLATASKEYWDNRYGALTSDTVLGVCDMRSTDGYSLNSLANAKASSGLIRYAGILFSPYSRYVNDTHRRMTMVHEIGHALGLGHPNDAYYYTNAASVMRQGTAETYYTPQAHDINDLNSKY